MYFVYIRHVVPFFLQSSIFRIKPEKRNPFFSLINPAISFKIGRDRSFMNYYGKKLVLNITLEFRRTKNCAHTL